MPAVHAAGRFYFLAYGNTQWCKWCYIFQLYYLPQTQALSEIEPPANFTGEWCNWYSNGAIKSTASYVNGMLHGKCVCWYDNGEEESESHFDNNKKNGRFRTWYKDGSPRCISNYKNGMKDGTETFLERNGRLISLEQYSDDKLEDIGLYSVDEFMIAIHYCDNKKSGRCDVHKKNDGKFALINYLNDERNGTQIQWYDNGQIKLTCYFKHDLKVGEYLEYYESGKIKARRYYLYDQDISREQYIEACKTDDELPKLEEISAAIANDKTTMH